VNIATYASRNLFRRRGRTWLTIAAVAFAVLVFSIIRTAIAMWSAGADEAAQDRIATRHKISITMVLPKNYIDTVRSFKPGIVEATWATWFDGKDPKERTPFFAAFAADHETWFTVMDEMKVEPDVLERWKKTKNGAILGDVLAKTLEVKPGDKLVITSGIYPGDWELEVVGLYTPLRKTVDRNSMVLRWDYLNDDPRNDYSKDKIGWVMSRVSDPKASAEIQKKIDATFDERDDQTLTMSERAFQLSFLGAFAAILNAFSMASIFILLVMVLILGNTVAMSVRERTHEYGVLRAIGFSPGHVVAFIVIEGALIAVVGAAIGALLTFLFVNVMMGPLIEQNMAAMFPYFRVPGHVFVLALAASSIAGAVAAFIPAMIAVRPKVTDALRRLD
jgi:putative ABC transport system permease protein